MLSKKHLGRLSLLISLIAMTSFGVLPSAATPSITPGVSGPITITTTIPALSENLSGNPVTIGSATGEKAVYGFWMQLVDKNAPVNPTPGWYHYDNATPFVNTPYKGGYCTSISLCAGKGHVDLDVTRLGTPVTFIPSYYNVDTLGKYFYIDAMSVPIPAGTNGLLPGDVMSLTFRDSFFNFPVNVDNYEIRFMYRAYAIGGSSNGPVLSPVTPFTTAAATLVLPSAPTATAVPNGAQITPAAVSPTPANYLITASPQVGGVTKTCTVTPPATNCSITGLTPGVDYTFTTQFVPDGGISSDISAASTPVTPLASPTITAVSPSIGSVSGGDQITLTGTAFESGATVRVGGVLCTSVTVVSSTQITCIAPAGTPGAKYVDVTNTNTGRGGISNAWKLVVKPTITTVSPATGSEAGRSQINIAGTGFVSSGLAVTIGGSPCVISASTATSITCATPAGSVGAANVVVTNADLGSTNLTGGFLYTAAPAPIPTPTTAPTAGLAATGSDSVNSVLLAMLVIVVGLGAVGIRRKKARNSGEPAKHRA